MPIIVDRNTELSRIRLDGDLDITGAAELKQALLDAVASGRKNCISLASATGLDITTLQLLWAAEREATVTGAVLVLEGPVPEGLRATLREAGFDRFPLADLPAQQGEVR
jgi:anti-anti-sigma regulatory factor